MDAEQIELDADSVDGVLCRFGYMLMPDPAAAFADTRRVLRPGGRLALAVWSAPERNPWVTIGFRLLVERGHMPPPEPGAPSPFALASEEVTRALLGARALPPCARRKSRFVHFRDIDDYTTYATDTGGRPRWCCGIARGRTRDPKAHFGSAFAPFARGRRIRATGRGALRGGGLTERGRWRARAQRSPVAGRRGAQPSVRCHVKRINCVCGLVIEAEDDDEFRGEVEEHLRVDHPELVGKVSADDILAQAEET